ncbi:ABC transporter ATP-binding protein [Tellurirhabdus rosea]|uniref:ABC transporter ATP-binding protein n=1 Tax=Tellurirhabdus rosea TaxID=2674997 RepID=UPI00224EBB01|nr:ABC transporter ATP-binding protein [Tellurirhabdus rosea]
MSDISIEISNLSKRYRLGTLGSGSFKQDLNLWWRQLFGGQKGNPSAEAYRPGASEPDFIWALQHINLQIKQGETWGIVGGNGSGKSTLLKIISRIIRPTEGVVRGNGRLSSLLEVGTGFHQELSGRENIFLSGYTLGMKSGEIRHRFDEIVEFSGISAFIDTPVKRYSSGMYVRLAFAVAAHLDSDILIADEVLAVGDSEFQKKCLDKMLDFSRHQGRTILFVSHNMQAVSHLCSQAVWLQKGRLMASGPVGSVIHQYMGLAQSNQLRQCWKSPADSPGTDWIRVQSISLIPEDPAHDRFIDTRTPLTFDFRLWVMDDSPALLVTLQLFNEEDICLFDTMSSPLECQKGLVRGTCRIPGNFLNNGSHSLSITIYRDGWEDYFYFDHCLTFDVADHREEHLRFQGKWWGAVRPHFPIQLVQEEEIKYQL